MSRSTDYIPFSRPMLGREEEEAVLRVMRSGWLTTGSVARQFEQEFAAYVGARHALSVNSATAGLHLGLVALDVAPGSRVVTSPYTFAATAEVIRYLDADPLFVDIEEDTFNISPSGLEKALKGYAGQVSAIIPVHIAGLPCKLEAIMELARSFGLPLIEDAAHAFPIKIANRTVGTFAELGVYSFYATKSITTGEGGMIVTDRDDLARRLRIMRLHGIDREVWDRHTGEKASWYYQVVEAGFKYNLSDLAAAIGCVQLKRASAFLRMRKKIAQAYLEGLAGLDFLILPQDGSQVSGQAAHAWHLFMVKIVPQRLTVNRDRFIEKLQERGIGVSVHYIPLHMMPYYRKRYGFKEQDFPVACKNFRLTISLPIYPGLTEDQVCRVIETIKQIGDRHYKGNRLAILKPKGVE